MKRKLVIILLSLALVITAMPLQVFAAITAQNPASSSANLTKGIKTFQDLSKTEITFMSLPIDIVYGTYCYANGQKYNENKDNREVALKIINSLSKDSLKSFAQYVPNYTVENTDSFKDALNNGIIPFIDQDGQTYQWDVESHTLFTFGAESIKLSPYITDYIEPESVVFQPKTAEISMAKAVSSIKDYYFLCFETPKMDDKTQKILSTSNATLHIRDENVSVLGANQPEGKTNITIDIPQIEAAANEFDANAILFIVIVSIVLIIFALFGLLLQKRKRK